MRSLAFYVLPLALTTTNTARAWPVEQAQVQNFYYTTVPTGNYVNYVTFSFSSGGTYTTCTQDGSLLEDVWYDCDDKQTQFRLDTTTANLYIKGRFDSGGCLSGQSSFSPSGLGDGWSVSSIGIQLSDQEDFC